MNYPKRFIVVSWNKGCISDLQINVFNRASDCRSFVGLDFPREKRNYKIIPITEKPEKK